MNYILQLRHFSRLSCYEGKALSSLLPISLSSLLSPHLSFRLSPLSPSLIYSFLQRFSQMDALTEVLLLVERAKDKLMAQEALKTGNDKREEKTEDGKNKTMQEEKDKKEIEEIEKLHQKEGVKLPVWFPSVPPRKTLVLDIDDTLVNSTTSERKKV
jgi:TFIIF-interacting CTD phosphatase-like protein